MDKLNLRFYAGDVARSSDMNRMSQKIDELIENLNAGGGGSSADINQLLEDVAALAGGLQGISDSIYELSGEQQGLMSRVDTLEEWKNTVKGELEKAGGLDRYEFRFSGGRLQYRAKDTQNWVTMAVIPTGGGDSGSSSGASMLGELENVVDTADDVENEDKMLVKKAGSDTWSVVKYEEPVDYTDQLNGINNALTQLDTHISEAAERAEVNANAYTDEKIEQATGMLDTIYGFDVDLVDGCVYLTKSKDTNVDFELSDHGELIMVIK